VVSSGSGVAQGSWPSAEADASRRTWIIGLAAVVALLVLANLVADDKADATYGWDARVNCAAVDAHVEGLDPYLVKNLRGTTLSYPYLPVTLDAFRPLCAGSFLVNHYRGIYLIIAVLCGLLLPSLGKSRPGLSEIALRVSCTFGAFVGLEWLLASGNFTIFSGLLTAVALALLLGGAAPETGDRFARRLAGAAVLGLLTSFKLVFCPVLAGLYFLPLPRARKLVLIAVAAASFALPILISMVFYADLFPNWLNAVTGQIPEQHSIYQLGSNQSLLMLASELADRLGLAGNRPVVFALYAFAATALLLAPFAWSVSRAVGWRERGDRGSWVSRLDQWLIAHPLEARRITAMAMYGLYLCAPRLKEYAFFELALYGVVLFVDLRMSALLAALACAVAFLSLASLAESGIVEHFGQANAAIACFWIVLADFCARTATTDVGDETRLLQADEPVS
jgi:hypothetical protein